MRPRPIVSDAAVRAALRVYAHTENLTGGPTESERVRGMREALEAAQPHLLRDEDAMAMLAEIMDQRKHHALFCTCDGFEV